MFSEARQHCRELGSFITERDAIYDQREVLLHELLMFPHDLDRICPLLTCGAVEVLVHQGDDVATWLMKDCEVLGALESSVCSISDLNRNIVRMLGVLEYVFSLALHWTRPSHLVKDGLCIPYDYSRAALGAYWATSCNRSGDGACSVCRNEKQGSCFLDLTDFGSCLSSCVGAFDLYQVPQLDCCNADQREAWSLVVALMTMDRIAHVLGNADLTAWSRAMLDAWEPEVTFVLSLGQRREQDIDTDWDKEDERVDGVRGVRGVLGSETPPPSYSKF